MKPGSFGVVHSEGSIAGVGVVMLDLRNVFRKCPAFAQISGNQGRPAEDPGWGVAQGEKERLRERGGAHKASPFCKGEDLQDPLPAGPHASEPPWRHIFPEDSSPSPSGDWEEMLTQSLLQ